MNDTTTDLDQTENVTSASDVSEVSDKSVEAATNTQTSSGLASTRPSTFGRNTSD
jgi:hypothetical protein